MPVYHHPIHPVRLNPGFVKLVVQVLTIQHVNCAPIPVYNYLHQFFSTFPLCL